MDIVDQLRAQADRSAEATQWMARAKSDRNQAAGDVGANYQGGTPEMMLEWKAADQIAHLREVLRVIAYGNWSKPTVDSEAANVYAQIVSEMQRMADATLTNS